VTVPVDVPVTVSLLGPFQDEELDLLSEQIRRFEAENPDIMVEIVDVREHSAQLRETMGDQLSGENTGLDVLVVDDAWLADFAAKGWLAPLDDAVKSEGLKMDAFLPGTAQSCTANGQLVSLPWIVDAGLLYYRQDLLDQHAAAPPASWPELQRLALNVKELDGLPAGHVWQGAAYESLTCNTLEFIWAYGGEVLDDAGQVIFDSPPTQAALQQMSDLVSSGASPADVTTYREGTTLAAFREGNSAFMRNWPYAWDRLQGDEWEMDGRVGVVSLPASCLVSQNLALSAHSIYPEKAFRLMRFLVGYEQQLQIARELGRPPALEAVYHDASLLEARPFFDALHTALAAARPRPRTVAYPLVSEAIYTQVHRLLAGEQDPAETAANIQQRIEAALGQ
jgi:multiple sugar transport system substrate-binding protein